jgi:protein-tyrosine phosphatase
VENSRLRKTLAFDQPLYVGARNIICFHRLANGEDGSPRVLVLAKARQQKLWRNSRRVAEKERRRIFEDVFVTVQNASKQSRLNVLIEAPLSMRISEAGEVDVAAHVESTMLRRVQLPVSGTLYLHSMPGRRERFTDVAAEIERCGVSRVICLASVDEIAKKSPDYAKALVTGATWKHDPLPIPDYGVPVDTGAFWTHAEGVALALSAGERILVHCGAGIGRTGTYAVAVARKLGLSFDDALAVVNDAGSRPETAEQRALVATLIE